MGGVAQNVIKYLVGPPNLAAPRRCSMQAARSYDLTIASSNW